MANPRICSIPGCGKPTKARGWCGTHWYRWRKHGHPLGGGTAHGEPERFFREIVMEYEGDECIAWPFAQDGRGYGLMYRDGKTQRVTRLICTEMYGLPPTPEHHAAHLCGKGHLLCVAKRHLVWKSEPENHADKFVHGTTNRGERSPVAKLTEEDIKEIRGMQGKLFQREIAHKFGITQSNVSRILKGELWGHI